MSPLSLYTTILYNIFKSVQSSKIKPDIYVLPQLTVTEAGQNNPFDFVVASMHLSLFSGD